MNMPDHRFDTPIHNWEKYSELLRLLKTLLILLKYTKNKCYLMLFCYEYL